MPMLSSSKTFGFIATLWPIIGTMVMVSVPPAIITSASPRRMRSAAMATVCSPDEQTADARDVHALLGLGHRAADDNVLDHGSIEFRHLGHRFADDMRKKIVGPGIAKAALEGFRDRGSDGGNYVCVTHIVRVLSIIHFKRFPGSGFGFPVKTIKNTRCGLYGFPET